MKRSLFLLPALWFALAAPAGAHVTVAPETAVKGGYAELTFRMPNERPQPTTRLEIAFPPEWPIVNVSVRPVPGWSYSVAKRKLATPMLTGHGAVSGVVSAIVWTGRLAPGEYQTFAILAGPLPREADRLVFRALQTYAGGEVVRWIQLPQQPGGPAAARPAPIVRLIDP